jgi:hypothetical protein
MGYPTVNRQAVEGFLKVYNSGGLYLLFDEKSKQAMQDFANIALKSYVTDLQEQAMKLMAAKKAMIEKQVAGQAAPTDAVAAIPVPPAAPQKSLITLTDL